ASVEAGRKDARIVEDDEIGGAQQAGEVAKVRVAEAGGGAVDVQQARGGAVGERGAGDQLVGQVVVEVGDQHGLIIGGSKRVKTPLVSDSFLSELPVGE